MAFSFFLLFFSSLFVFLSASLEYTKHDDIYAVKDLPNRELHPNTIFLSSGYSIKVGSKEAMQHATELRLGKSGHVLFGKKRNRKYPENAVGAFLLHLKEGTTQATKEKIETSLGITLDVYIPHNTYLVHATCICVVVVYVLYVAVTTAENVADFTSRAMMLEGVSWIGTHRNEYKKTSSLHESNVKGYEPLVEFKGVDENYKWFDHQGISAFFAYLKNPEKMISRILAEIKETLPSATVASAHVYSKKQIIFIVPNSDDLLAVADVLVSFSSVLYVERRFPSIVNNKWSKGINQYGSAPSYAAANTLNTPIAAGGLLTQLTGKSEVIGVVDSGLDASNCMFFDTEYYLQTNELAPFISYPGANLDIPAPTSTALSHRKIVQYIVGENADIYDDEGTGHGTHVSGSVAGNIVGFVPFYTSETSDLYQFNGVAYDAKLAFYDAAASTTKSLSIPGASSFLQWAYSAGARVHSNSWGANTIDSSYSSQAVDFDDFLWKQRDMVVLCAAGNDGANGFQTVTSPSTAKNVVTVGATMNDYNSFEEAECSLNGGDGYLSTSSCGLYSSTIYDKSNMAAFSSMGPTKDGRYKPDVSAPGYQVLSARSQGPGSQPTCPSNSYKQTLRKLLGTSMATPLTAGTAALIRQFYREGWHTGAKNFDSGFIPSGALLKATLISSATPLSGNQDIGCCGYTSGASNLFTSPFPDPSQGKCCCADSVCRNRVSGLPNLNKFRTLPGSIPNNVYGFGRPLTAKTIFNLGLSTKFNLLLLLRNSSSIVKYVSNSTVPQKVPLYSNLGDSVISQNQVLETAICAFSASGTNEYPLKITLAWTDYPGAALAATALVNDLNLVVTAGGATYLGNMGSSSDNLNNVEQVTLLSGVQVNTPYVIQVFGSTIAQGPQPFALVASGPVTHASGSPGLWSCNGASSPTLAPVTPTPTSVPVIPDVSLQSLNFHLPGLAASYAINDYVPARWNATGPFTSFVLSLISQSSGSTISSITVNRLTRWSPFKVPDVTLGQNYKIRVASSDTSKFSDSRFFVVTAAVTSKITITAPVFGAIVSQTEASAIGWTYTGSSVISYVVTYKTPTSNSWTPIAIDSPTAAPVVSGSVTTDVISAFWLPSNLAAGNFYEFRVCSSIDNTFCSGNSIFWTAGSTLASTATTTNGYAYAVKLSVMFNLNLLYSQWSASQTQLDVLRAFSFAGVSQSQVAFSIANNVPIYGSIYLICADFSAIFNGASTVVPLSSQMLVAKAYAGIINSTISKYESLVFASPMLGNVYRISASYAQVKLCPNSVAVESDTCPALGNDDGSSNLLMIVIICGVAGLVLIFVLYYLRNRRPHAVPGGVAAAAARRDPRYIADPNIPQSADAVARFHMEQQKREMEFYEAQQKLQANKQQPLDQAQFQIEQQRRELEFYEAQKRNTQLVPSSQLELQTVGPAPGPGDPLSRPKISIVAPIGILEPGQPQPGQQPPRSPRMSMAMPSMAAPLPPGWTENVDKQGRTYYLNSETQKMTFTRPGGNNHQGSLSIAQPPASPQFATLNKPDSMASRPGSFAAPRGSTLSMAMPIMAAPLPPGGPPAYSQPAVPVQAAVPNPVPAAAPLSPLPAGWIEQKDRSGRTFYMNTQTNKMTFVRPVVVDYRDLQ